MNAARLRALTNEVIACSPVVFRLPDGRVMEYVAWERSTAERDDEGKPKGTPTLTIELGFPRAAVSEPAEPQPLEAGS